MSAVVLPSVCLSIVSHGQGHLIRLLLGDLLGLRDEISEIIVTLNLPEDESFLGEYRDQLPIFTIRNEKPKGFGANHNAAFAVCKSAFFIVVNPDVRLRDFELARLLSAATSVPVGVAAPGVYSEDGVLQDSARSFPTVSQLLRRKLGRTTGPDYNIDLAPIKVDWVAGMFMVFRREVYQTIGGFDERYFMYFEDVDICRRLHALGFTVLLLPEVRVVHEAQRASRRKMRYFLWHLSSACRYLLHGA